MLARKADPAAAKAKGETLPRGSEMVLVVEDEERVRKMIGQLLRALGYQVLEAQNGREAMEIWQKSAPRVNLLLTDMVMPEGMTGLELAEQLKFLQPSLKVIISSGYSAEIAQAGVPSGAGIGYLPKPYTAQKIAEAVRNCLDSK
jgi:CheY-like chemotaxis protein